MHRSKLLRVTPTNRCHVAVLTTTLLHTFNNITYILNIQKTITISRCNTSKSAHKITDEHVKTFNNYFTYGSIKNILEIV